MFALRLSLIYLALALALPACTGRDLHTDAAFWLRALGDPAMELTPSWALSAPGVTQERVIFGTVAGHRPSRVRGLEKLLVVEEDMGTNVQVRYRIGQNLGLPVKLGDRIRLLAYRRQHPEDGGMDIGMLVYVRRLAAPTQAETDAAAAAVDRAAVFTLKATDELVALVQMDGILPKDKVPESLRTIEPSDLDAYHESGTWDGQCFEMRSHQHFTVARPKWLHKVVGGRPSARLVAPGSRFALDDGKSRFGVLLLENRRTTSSSCSQLPEPTWSYMAVAKPRPKSTAKPTLAPARVQPAI